MLDLEMRRTKNFRVGGILYGGVGMTDIWCTCCMSGARSYSSYSYSNLRGR